MGKRSLAVVPQSPGLLLPPSPVKDDWMDNSLGNLRRSSRKSIKVPVETSPDECSLDRLDDEQLEELVWKDWQQQGSSSSSSSSAPLVLMSPNVETRRKRSSPRKSAKIEVEEPLVEPEHAAGSSGEHSLQDQPIVLPPSPSRSPHLRRRLTTIEEAASREEQDSLPRQKEHKKKTDQESAVASLFGSKETREERRLRLGIAQDPSQGQRAAPAPSSDEPGPSSSIIAAATPEKRRLPSLLEFSPYRGDRSIERGQTSQSSHARRKDQPPSELFKALQQARSSKRSRSEDANPVEEKTTSSNSKTSDSVHDALQARRKKRKDEETTTQEEMRSKYQLEDLTSTAEEELSCVPEDAEHGQSMEPEPTEEMDDHPIEEEAKVDAESSAPTPRRSGRLSNGPVHTSSAVPAAAAPLALAAALALQTKPAVVSSVRRSAAMATRSPVKASSSSLIIVSPAKTKTASPTKSQTASRSKAKSSKERQALVQSDAKTQAVRQRAAARSATTSNTAIDVPEGYRLTSTGALVPLVRQQVQQPAKPQPARVSTADLARILARAEEEERKVKQRQQQKLRQPSSSSSKLEAHAVPEYLKKRKEELEREREEETQRQIGAIRKEEQRKMELIKREAQRAASQKQQPVASSSSSRLEHIAPKARSGSSSRRSTRFEAPEAAPSASSSKAQQPFQSSNTNDRLAARQAWEASRQARSALLEAEKQAATLEREKWEEEQRKEEYEKRKVRANPVPDFISGGRTRTRKAV